jgi:hypothetical protein
MLDLLRDTARVTIVTMEFTAQRLYDLWGGVAPYPRTVIGSLCSHKSHRADHLQVTQMLRVLAQCPQSIGLACS